MWGIRDEVSCFCSEEIIEWGWGTVLDYSCECKQGGADCDGPSQTSENEWKTEKHQKGNRMGNILSNLKRGGARKHRTAYRSVIVIFCYFF